MSSGHSRIRSPMNLELLTMLLKNVSKLQTAKYADLRGRAHWWLSMAALGRPVVPLVNWRLHIRCGSTLLST